MLRFNSLFRGSFRIPASLGRVTKVTLFLCVFAVFGAATPLPNWFKLDQDKRAPADWGYGPGKGKGLPRPNLRPGQTPVIPKAAPANAARTQSSAPSGGGAGGYFSQPFPWPIIPIQLALLPDGRVMNYGTDQQGNQGATMLYDIWNPALGTVSSAHTILQNTTSTDIFCGAASLLAGSGNLLITDGDLTVKGTRNYSNNNINLFTPSNNTLSPAGSTAFARWYPSLTTMPNGDKLLMGGTVTPNVGEPTPEIFSVATSSWSTLNGISIPQPNGGPPEWYYPRGFVGADNGVYLLQHTGGIYRLDPDFGGSQQNTGVTLDAGDPTYAAAMFYDAKNNNPFAVMMLRNPNPNNGLPNAGVGNEVQVVDLSKTPPVAKTIGNLSYIRSTGELTVLADGSVLASAGSAVFNQQTNVAYQTELYIPKTGKWTLGASAAIPRLYHNSALLLPDGSVLTAGGGAPGPVNELNGEIYYPPYLYLQDGSGNPAPRPTVVSAPSSLTNGQTFQLTVGAADTISAINLIRTGSMTHNFNSEQRLIPVQFTQNGTTITATLNAPAQLMPPGYYMLFAINASGVPAVAPIIPVSQPFPDLVPTSLSYDSTTGLFTVAVTNQGTAATPNGVVIGNAFYVDGTKVSWGEVQGPLAAGASVTINSSGGGPYTISPGTHTIGVLTDDVSRMAESNKNNNALSVSITVTGNTSLPDLVPTSLSYDGTTGLFTVAVTNQGTAATPNGVVIGNAFYVDGTKVTWGAVQGPLAAGASVTINSSGGGPYTISPGTHTIGVLVDDVNRMTESNKNNNALSVSITVTGNSSLPDLVPTSLSYDSTTGLFTVAVTNQGTAATPNGVVIGNAFYVDGTKVSWGEVQGPLAAGASVTINSSGGGPYTISPGTHTIGVLTDDVSRMAESNKNNNALSVSITVTGNTSLPDLVPTSLSYDGTTGLFTVAVTNQGTAATPNGVVIGNAFYVDGTKVTWGAVQGPLAAGASVTINSSGGGPYTISPGTHTIGVLVDDVNRMTESNKNNNAFSEAITIP